MPTFSSKEKCLLGSLFPGSPRKRLAAIVIVGISFVSLSVGIFLVLSSDRVTPQTESKSATNTPVPQVAEELVEGRKVYEANCSTCHGLRGEGQPDWHIKKPDGTLPAPPHDASGHTWHHGDGLLYRIVREGGAIAEVPEFKSGMPAFGTRLSQWEIRAALLYIKEFWGDAEAPWGEKKRALQEEGSLGDPFPPESLVRERR